MNGGADAAPVTRPFPRLAAGGKRRPLVVEVKRNSLDDGPGIRTTIFFKGCPLACVWCHNPEAIRPGPEIMRVDAECLRCGACVAACPNGALSLGRGGDPAAKWLTGRRQGGTPPGRTPGVRPAPQLASRAPEPAPRAPQSAPPAPVLDRSRCRTCGRCVEACPGRGVRLVGAYHEPEDLAELAALDLPFFRNSGGGVTLSGGEATLYPRYLERLLAALGAREVPVLLETCGHWAWPVFERRILPYLDTIYFDVKLADPVAHRRYTGRDNAIILANLRRLAELTQGEAGAGAGGGDSCSASSSGGRRSRPFELLVRVPLVPGLTATPENLAGIAALLRGLGLHRVALLPYNPLWLAKADGVGRDQTAGGTSPPYRHAEWMSQAEKDECARVFLGFEIVA